MKKKVLFFVMVALIVFPFAAVYAGELTVGNKVVTDPEVPSECGNLYQYGLKFDSGDMNDGEVKSAYGNTIKIFNFDTPNQPLALDWVVTSGPGILKVVVKIGIGPDGGDGLFPETFSDFTKSGSVGPFNRAISHVSFCWNDQPADPRIDVMKYVWDGNVDDWDDANSAPGPYLSSSQDPVEFKFVVTNTGNVSLENISLSDSDISSLVDEQDQTCTPPTTLAVNDSFTCYGSLAWQAGQHNNVATAYGEEVGGSGTDQATDPANYFGDVPKSISIDVVKYVWDGNVDDWDDANSAPGPYLSSSQDPVEFKFVVTNTGNVSLENISLSDSDISSLVDEQDQTCTPPTTLAVNDSFTCYGSLAWQAGQHNNVATAYGEEVGGSGTDQATDPANYFGDVPKSASIDVEKYVWDGNTWQDADTTTGPKLASDKGFVKFKFEVENIGDVTLENISLTDNIITNLFNDASYNDACTPTDPLTAGDTFTCYGSLAWQAGQHTNTATVTGEDNSQATITDSDPANYFGTLSSISFVKEASPQVYSAVNDEILYTYTVTNTGNTILSEVTVTENASDFTGTGTLPSPVYSAGSSTLGSPEGTLLPGESATYTATYAVTQPDVDAGLIDNTATATGEDPDENILTDIDNERVEGPKQGASIHLSKTAAPLTYSKVGDIITYTYVVTNNGNLTLTKVAVTENSADFTGTGTLPAPVYTAGSSTLGSPEGTLVPGESATYTATYAITQADLDAKLVDNIATATGEDPNENVVKDTDDARVVDPRGDGAIHLSKIATPTTYKKAGDTITYTYVVTNTGDLTLTNVDVTENSDDFTGAGSLPSPYYVSGSSTKGSPEGTLLPGESATYKAVYTITQADVTAKKVINIATATGENNGNTYKDRDSETINAITDKQVDPKPDKPSGGGDMNIISLINKVFGWFYEFGLNLGLYK